MEVLELEKSGTGAFRICRFEAKAELRAEDLLGKLDKLLLASKACDSAYYPVYSELAEAIKKNLGLIRKGQIDEVMKEIFPEEGGHGKRFVIFLDNDKAFLLGELGAALKLLGGK